MPKNRPDNKGTTALRRRKTKASAKGVASLTPLQRAEGLLRQMTGLVVFLSDHGKDCELR
jgi:hypothetical protein